MNKLYKDFTLAKINDPEYSHIKLLLFWPIYGIVFLLLERFLPLNFHDISCKIDAYIPFCEYFIIPYYSWFVFIIGALIYTLFSDIKAFRKYMIYITISYSLTVLIYFIYPSMQTLRPSVFERNNVFVDIVKFLYSFDTNTNTCPSLHVIGMFGSVYGLLNTKKFSTPFWRIFLCISSILVCSSTVFLKQHSIIDLFAGCFVSLIVYKVTEKIENERIPQTEKPKKLKV